MEAQDAKISVLELGKFWESWDELLTPDWSNAM